MYLNYLNTNGEVVTRKLKDIGTTWAKMHEYNVEFAKREEVLFLAQYGLKATIFNVSNLRITGHVYLTNFYTRRAIRFGAIDKRTIKWISNDESHLLPERD